MQEVIMSKLESIEKCIKRIEQKKNEKEFDFEKHYKAGAVVFDTKAVVERQWVDGRL
mgnify:CR=1 FL=1